MSNKSNSTKSFNISITENNIISLEKSHKEVALNAITKVCNVYQKY
jgi:hypothetical protein